MGTVVLSIDAELCWGFHDRDALPTERVASARSGWRTLLDLCEEFEIPATWAVVGHLMLEDCDRQHADHPTPPGWFDHERGTDALPEDWRFAPDLVSATADAPVDHDIGCHTFSHVELGDSETTRRLARAEVTANVRAAQSLGLRPTSFVFPRNNVGNRQELAAAGIACYRGHRPDGLREGRFRRPLRKLARGTVLREPPPLVRPRVDEFGLVEVPASLFLFGFEGPARSVIDRLVGDPIVRQAKLGIDAVADTPEVFHIWCHPNDLVDEQSVARLREIFAHIEYRRARSDLRVETMADVADAVLAERRWAQLEPV
jgi:peptidoglycan/xylan/chitin deacetylase (PgdA/CDA1 family)